MADAGSVSPTDVLPQSETPSATASHARSSPSMSAADSFPSTASSSRASPIPQDTEMTAKDKLIASQMLDDDERAELDETGSVAQTSESVPQSVAESEAEPEDGNAVVDKSTRPRHVPGPDGDIKTLLWVAPKRESVMSVLTKIKRLRGAIEDLCYYGLVPGPVLVRCALGTFNKTSPSNRILHPPVDVSNDQSTVEEFFSLRNNRNRNIFKPRVAALIHHHLNSTVTLGVDSAEADKFDVSVGFMCGNCARGLPRPFKSCRLAVINGLLFLRGTCTNCYAMGYEATCSCTRESKMYRSVKLPATSAPAPTIIPPFVVPPRSRAARPSALGTLEPKEIESSDTKFDPTKKFQRPYTSDLKQGLTKADKRELLKLLKDTKKEIIEAPEKSPKKLPKKSPKKSPKTPSPCKKATLYKKQTSSPRKKAAPAEHPVSPVTFGQSDRPSARVPSPPRTSHLSYIPPAAADKAPGLNNWDRSKSEEYQPGADDDKTEDEPSLSKKPRLDR
ncbi:hypothetical protein AA0113_g12738 [Alternaria arborescens]|uniref:Uncharacterized protein n=1 Tax=Alternaria arborescens TaxID=156630 RepID=A0A4Q4PW75_9PLEO|nr:hypothetical protein AA0113_g12738 [Alternaria arborescens]